jgi:hypothetical protein
MKNDRKADYQMRDAVLSLLSDNENAAVCTAETAGALLNGDEYLDLEHLDLGVRQAPWTSTPMGRVLPRKAVQDATWAKILSTLAPSPKAKKHPTP